MDEKSSRSNRRTFNRKKRRIPCQVWVGEREHSALVLDLSPSGLFIQTHAKTRRGDRLDLRMSGNDDAVMDLVVEVARIKQVPPNLLTVARGGIGVRIVNAPEEYFQLLEAPRRAEGSTPELELEGEPGLHFQVYVAQISGSRSRRVEVAAPDADAAAAHALEELGDEWKVLRVEPV